MSFTKDEQTSYCGEYNENNHERELIPVETLSARDKRSVVFHLLYAMEAFDYQVTLESIVDNLSRGYGYVIEPSDSVFQHAAAVIMSRDGLDKEILPLLDRWRFERLGTATRLILRYALWELKSGMLDSTIVINEAIELAKSFAERDSYRFINGILDQWCKKHK